MRTHKAITFSIFDKKIYDKTFELLGDKSFVLLSESNKVNWFLEIYVQNYKEGKILDTFKGERPNGVYLVKNLKLNTYLLNTIRMMPRFRGMSTGRILAQLMYEFTTERESKSIDLNTEKE